MLQEHLENNGYVLMAERKIRKGLVIRLYHAPDQVLSWCISARGNGHYFQSRHACLAYAYGRGWLQHYEVVPDGQPLEGWKCY